MTFLSPAFVVVTGDWVTYRGERELEQLDDVLRQLPRGRLGTVGVLGNHDYGFGWKSEAVGDAVSSIVRGSGVSLLRNEALSIAGLTFVGLDDFWGPRFAPEDVLRENVSAGAFSLHGGRTLYVNRGVGHLRQVRFNVRPEVTVFRLTAGREA